MKPAFSALPMTHSEHMTQSSQGEKSCLERHLGGEWTVEQAKAWFDAKGTEYLRMWVES